jgi:hypothetical protein
MQMEKLDLRNRGSGDKGKWWQGWIQVWYIW